MIHPALEVTDLKVYYGFVHAVKGVTFSVAPGEIVSLIGANGAGKTSLLRAVSGMVQSSGQIILDGLSLDGIAAHKRVQLGLGHSPEGRGVFQTLTVLENLQMGAFLQTNSKKIRDKLDYCYDLFPKLRERAKQLSGTLSGGEQQMVAISRALMSFPKLLILDEPSLGLAPKIVQQIFSIIQKLNADGMTILLVEQNASQALKISHRAHVLETGLITLQGSGSELLSNDLVRQSYLGL